MTNPTELLESANRMRPNTLMETFQMEFTQVTPQSVTAQMPVTQKVAQPSGVLHGGASAALAETVGSMAAILLCANGKPVLGIDIYMNHVRAAQIGSWVRATATALHTGKTLQHWDIKITNPEGKLISYGKHTTIVLQERA